MKKKYVTAEIEVFMFNEKQMLVASSVTDESTTQAEHDNAFLGFDEFM